MELTRLRPVYEAGGPFATVYLEGRAPGEDAGTQIQLRWESLRRRLEGEGATAGALDGLEARVLADRAGEEQANGRILVATENGVELQEEWDAALGAGDRAYWTVVPELGSYVRESAQAVRMLIVVADREQAQIRRLVVAGQHDPWELDATSVSGGSAAGVHKPRGGALSHNQIQRRAEEAVKHNAKQIAQRMRSISSGFRPHAIVLAGEVQARTAIREEISEALSDLCVDSEHGLASETALADELAALARRTNEQHRESLADRVGARLAHEGAVQGDPLVPRAAEMGAVETLFFEDSVPAAREAFLLKTCAETSSELEVLPAGTGLPDGVAATLRFPLPY